VLAQCHPAITALCNRLFYSGRIHDGVTATERAPLVEGLATVVVVDVADAQVRLAPPWPGG
jgi:superfamily I DNA and/or RNA helicase